ncbi:transposase [Flavobacterium sp. TBRC 19031]|uniref:transposase n=1 Tax=Flavobacterium mekongense TaxID=3379707 RepID=UPI00399BF448
MQKDVFEPGVTYHFYNRGNNHENIFLEKKNYNYFLLLIKKYLLPISEIYAYCLLKNHFHLALKIKEKEELPLKYQEKIHLPFSNLFNSYTKSINKAYQRTGSLFQEHPQRNRIKEENYLRQLIVYIHLNPLKHKFTDRFDSYKHSSYQSYLSGLDANLEREYIFELFGGKENFIFLHQESQIKYEGLIEQIDKFDF